MRKISKKEICFSATLLLALSLVIVHAQFISRSFKQLQRKVNAMAAIVSPVDPTFSRITTKKKTTGMLPLPPVSNVLVNNNNGIILPNRFTQSGTSLLAFGSNVLVAYNDAGSLSLPGANHFVGISYSTDGGTSFTDIGGLPPSAIGDGGYPVLARNNTTGRIYLSTVGFNTSLIQVFRSDNNGLAWAAPVIGTPGGNQQDKPWIAVDNIAGAGNGNVYLASRSFAAGGGLRFYRSVDHGNTYGPVAGILLSGAPSAQAPFITVGTNHHVYVFWYETGFIKMSKSTDLGLTFSLPVNVASGLVGGVNGNLGLVGARQGLPAPAPFNSNEFPHAAVNPVSGHLYVTYGNDGASTDKADIFMVQSTDGGLTWSVPVKVNDDVTTTDQWQPTIAVMPDGLNLGIFYYSRQEDAANNLFKYYMRPASISGAVVSFASANPVSSVASYPEFGRDNVLSLQYMGVSDQVVALNDGYAISWADNRDDLAGALPRKDPNVYFAKVGPLGPNPVSQLSYFASSFTGGNGDAYLDANETINLTVTLKNLGGAAATGISAVLSTSAPGVTITQNTSAYNDISSGATGDNLTEYVIATNGDFSCGQAEFTLTVTESTANNVFQFSLPTAGITGAPINFDNNTITSIPDNSSVDIPFTVSGFTGILGKVTLSMHLTHTFNGDLAISLISPDGEAVDLSSNNGGSGDNYGSSCSGRTLFDDDAIGTIVSAASPFIGSFKPEQALSSLNGKSGTAVNGTWILRIRDQAALDVGQFKCATLSLAASQCPTTIVNAGATITAENCSPANGAMDPSENVTVSFCLENNGTLNTSSLVATLLNTGGITGASSAQNFGVLEAGGDPVCRSFSFTPTGSCGSTVTASLQLQDGTVDLGVVHFEFTLGATNTATTTFSNSAAITIPGLGTGTASGAAASVYPSSIVVSGLTGVVSKLTVSLNNLNHTFPGDIDMLLVSPSGQKFILLSDAQGSTDMININYTLDDDAATLVPTTGVPASGTYKPTNYGTGDLFPAPAPAAPYESAGNAGSATLANTFNGSNPNGTWQLYITDDAGIDAGTLSGGWALNITTATTTCCAVSNCVIACPPNIEVTNDPNVCGAVVNYTLPTGTGDCGTITGSPAPGSFFPFGKTTVTVSGSGGGSCTFDVTVVPANPSDCNITGNTSICSVESTEWCAPEGMTNYEWTGPDQFKVFTRCATITAPGLYTVAFTDGNGCRKQCSQELEVQVCPVACTYSQGFYGNKKGMACYTLNGVSSNISSTQLMLNAFGLSTSKVFGSVSNKQFFTLYKTDITNGDIFKMLPGNGNSMPLVIDNISPFDGAWYAAQNTWYLVPIPGSGSQKGKINNMLLSQLMTLWFNIQTSVPLGSIELAEDTLITKAQTSCGSGIPTGPEVKFGLPHSVVEFLNGGNGYSNDVQGLYQLANDVLGGVTTVIPAAEVQKAVAAINNAFDGCRVLTRTLPYDATIVTRPVNEVILQPAMNSTFALKVFPNPSAASFAVQILSANNSQAQLQVTNQLGQVIERRMATPGQVIQMGARYIPGTYMIQVVQGSETRLQKLVKIKQ